jgi:molybdopterin converting factor small subunit
VAEALRKLLARYPELGARLLLAGGRFGAHFLVYLDGRVVRTEGLETQAVSESSELKIFPVLAGG